MGWLIADAFSMFDYGGSMGMVGLVRWGGGWVVVFISLMGMDYWVGGNRFRVVVSMLNKVFSHQILGARRMVFGFGLFCVSLFVYLCFIGVYSIFPYVFCLTAHFSHNFCISIVLWFATLMVNLAVRVKGFGMHFVPRGLSWYQAAPVGVFEMVRNLSRLVTLGARLTMNMIAGKLLLCVGSVFFGSMVLNGAIISVVGFCFVSILLALTGWEIIVGVIQAYIFTFLRVTYVDEIPAHRVGG